MRLSAVAMAAAMVVVPMLMSMPAAGMPFAVVMMLTVHIGIILKFSGQISQDRIIGAAGNPAEKCDSAL